MLTEYAQEHAHMSMLTAQWSKIKNFRQWGTFWKSFTKFIGRCLIWKLISIGEDSPSFNFFGPPSDVWQFLKVGYSEKCWFLSYVIQTWFEQKLLNQIKNGFRILKVHEKRYFSCMFHVLKIFSWWWCRWLKVKF